jgi:hypothetical protein
MIAVSAGCYYIGPGMQTAKMLGVDVVNGQVFGCAPAILAGVIIPPEHLFAY